MSNSREMGTFPSKKMFSFQACPSKFGTLTRRACLSNGTCRGWGARVKSIPCCISSLCSFLVKFWKLAVLPTTSSPEPTPAQPTLLLHPAPPSVLIKFPQRHVSDEEAAGARVRRLPPHGNLLLLSGEWTRRSECSLDQRGWSRRVLHRTFV